MTEIESNIFKYLVESCTKIIEPIEEHIKKMKSIYSLYHGEIKQDLYKRKNLTDLISFIEQNPEKIKSVYFNSKLYDLDEIKKDSPYYDEDGKVIQDLKNKLRLKRYYDEKYETLKYLVVTSNPNGCQISQEFNRNVSSLQGPGHYPIHYSAYYAAPIYIQKMLIDFYPEGLQMQEATNNNLPIHYAKTTETVIYFLKIFPNSAFIKNFKGQLPIHVLVNEEIDIEAIQLLISIYPRSIIVRDPYNGKYIYKNCNNLERSCFLRRETLLFNIRQKIYVRKIIYFIKWCLYNPNGIIKIKKGIIFQKRTNCND